MCGAPVAPRPENGTFPFCSERCRAVDLGSWLDERYRIPGTESPGDDPDDTD